MNQQQKIIQEPAATKNKPTKTKNTPWKCRYAWICLKIEYILLGNIWSASNLGVPAWAVAFRRAIPWGSTWEASWHSAAQLRQKTGEISWGMRVPQKPPQIDRFSIDKRGGLGILANLRADTVKHFQKIIDMAG